MAQPNSDGRDLAAYLTDVSADESLDGLDIVVAWVKRSGLARVWPQLQRVRARGNKTRLIVGIDGKVTTRQGLELAREMFSQVYVLHEENARTFHPKIYFAYGEEHCTLLVGSHNLTAGGLFYNQEAGLEVECSSVNPLADALRSYIDRLIADSEVCLTLDDELLQRLVADPHYGLLDEDAEGAAWFGDGPAAGGAAAEHERRSRESVFGRSREARRRDPAPSSRAERPTPRPSVDGDSAPMDEPGPVQTPRVVRRWYKKLTASDAQQPLTARSNPKGHMTLGRGRRAIASTSYFRDEFFRDLSWRSTDTDRGTRQAADIEATVIVRGENLGRFTFSIDYQESRIAGQGNVPTWLHWRDFNPYLRGHNHVGDTATLERLSDGSLVVTIDLEPTGPVVD